MVTAELAACLPVLAILLMVGIAAVSLADGRVRAQDAASAVARAEARGDPDTAVRLFAQTAPGGAVFSVQTNGGEVTATVRVESRPFNGWFGSYSITERSVAAIEAP